MPDNIENVLILQGGGSLGAFGCGVFKALAKNNIKIDIIAGTSIGGVNASIIAGSKDRHPEETLEQFWLELAETSINLDSPFGASLIGENLSGMTGNQSMLSFYHSAAYGNSKLFVPRWNPEYMSKDPLYFKPAKWTYLYDHSRLAKTLEKYVDYDKLRPGGNPNARLIVSAVNVLTAEPLTFDSSRQQITPKHILATSGYPLYYLPWVEIEEGLYAWDGSLLSNTPLREVIDAAPVTDKRVFLVENYPKKIDRLPESLPEVIHRARDIVFSDKTMHNVQMSKVITYYLRFIEDLYRIVDKHADLSKVDKSELASIRKKYKRISEEHGAEIKSISHITRDEPTPHLYENADFSVNAIKNSIREGEVKTTDVIRNMKSL
ncbi:MAG: patatin-like phospholipase family protein [Nitrososphaera sp.]